MTFDEILARKEALEQRCKDGATARDVAEAQELVQQYIDELERLENTAKPVPVSNPVDGGRHD